MKDYIAIFLAILLATVSTNVLAKDRDGHADRHYNSGHRDSKHVDNGKHNKKSHDTKRYFDKRAGDHRLRKYQSHNRPKNRDGGYYRYDGYRWVWFGILPHHYGVYYPSPRSYYSERYYLKRYYPELNYSYSHQRPNKHGHHRK